MDEHKAEALPRGCSFVKLPKVTDERGMLAFGESEGNIPFSIKRVFWTYNITNGRVRGDHAHRTCQMVLFPLAGSFTIELDDGYTKKELRMEEAHVGILIPPGVWCRLYDFSPSAVCVSLASEPYSAEDYIHNYDEFLRLVRK